MTLFDWVRTHPQRTCGLLLTAFGSMQTGLALFQSQIPPMVVAIVTSVFGLVMSVLAWGIKNLKDQDPLPEEKT